MSFSELLNKAVNSIVVSFIDTLSKKYDIPKEDLISIFNGTSDPKTVVENKIVSEVKLQPSDELNKMNKNELIAHCKTKGLKTTGTKQELIERLTGGNVASTVTEKKTTKSNTNQPVEEKPVLKNIQSTIQTVQIKKNSFGNFEHPDTGLVFDRINQKVIGKQNKNGNIDTLTDEDVELCNKYKFKYDIPENLNNGVKNSISIEGLDEEDEDDEGEDIINEAEELLEEEEELEEDEEFYEDDE
jgi:hypothetical protein